MSAGDPVRRLALIAHLDRRQWEQGRDVVPMLEAAASSDPEVARMLHGWKQQRAAMIADAVRAIASSLRPDVAPEWAVATVRALSSHDVFNELVRGEGWSPEPYEEWLALLLAGLLLGGQVAAPFLRDGSNTTSSRGRFTLDGRRDAHAGRKIRSGRVRRLRALASAPG